MVQALIRLTGRPRVERLDLLRPHDSDTVEIWAIDLIVDPKAQLALIADLYGRGLMSVEEFERQRRVIAGS